MDKELEFLFQAIWEDLNMWDKDDIPINRIRNKLKQIQIQVIKKE